MTDPDAEAKATAGPSRTGVLLDRGGVVHSGDTTNAARGELDVAFALNVRGMINSVRVVPPGKSERPGGAVLHIASVASSVICVPVRFACVTTKAAVTDLAGSAAADFAILGIFCNAICPETMDGPTLHVRLRASRGCERARSEINARHGMGRTGRLEVTASFARRFASREPRFATGQVPDMDRGRTIRPMQ